MTRAKKTSYAIVFALLIATIWLRLGPVLLTGLLSYMILDLTNRLLRPWVGLRISRWLALLVFLCAAAATSWMLVRFLKHTLHTLPQIAATAIPKAITLAETYHIELPFENAYELREMVLNEIKENAQIITKASGLLTIGFFHIIIAIFIAILCFFCDPPQISTTSLYDEIRLQFGERMKTLMLGVEKVLGAQVTISAAYTVLTLLFLLIMGFPHRVFLTLATFIFGILPIIGNIISNIIIVATGINLSTRHAAFALAFLIVIHKSGYFVYSRVLGSSMKMPMWQTLSAILLGEIVMGVPGIILAPAFLHYIKEELQKIPSEQM
jgi:predicted PurR-regulated permease PerM